MTERQKTQRQRILELLQAAGPGGLTNVFLNAVCYRYGARIWELRKTWEIETVQESESVFRFIFHGKRKPGQQQLFKEVA